MAVVAERAKRPWKLSRLQASIHPSFVDVLQGESRNILHTSFCSGVRLINLEDEINCDAAQASRYHRLH